MSWIDAIACSFSPESKVHFYLEVELVQRRQQLSDRTDALVRDVDAVVDGDGDEAGVQGRPQALLGNLVAAWNSKGIEFHIWPKNIILYQ